MRKQLHQSVKRSVDYLPNTLLEMPISQDIRRAGSPRDAAFEFLTFVHHAAFQGNK